MEEEEPHQVWTSQDWPKKSRGPELKTGAKIPDFGFKPSSNQPQVRAFISEKSMIFTKRVNRYRYCFNENNQTAKIVT